MPKKKQKPVPKKQTAEFILESIKSSSVFGKKKEIREKEKHEPVFRSPEPFRSDSNIKRVPSYDGRKMAVGKTEQMKYTGDLPLKVGVAYNKGGTQVLMDTELRDAGKKTSQLEE